MPVESGKPLSRVAKKRLQAQDEIVTTALEILFDRGVEQLTLGAVTEKLGLTKPAIYHYFRSKEDLIRALVLELTRQETLELIDTVSKNRDTRTVLGTLIRAFYDFYRPRLNAFRLVFCQLQLLDMKTLGVDRRTLREDINPLSQRLFDIIVTLLSDNGRYPPSPEMRRLAVSAWLAAIGLMEMIAMAAAIDDPLRHSDEDLLGTLEEVFNASVERLIQ